MKCLLLYLSIALAQIANAGVSQGNPKRADFFNMRADYRIIGSENWNFWSPNSADEILVALPLSFGIEDRFVVIHSPATLKLRAGERICERVAEYSIKIEKIWISKTCQNQDVRALFDTFVQSVVPLKFSH